MATRNGSGGTALVGSSRASATANFVGGARFSGAGGASLGSAKSKTGSAVFGGLGTLSVHMELGRLYLTQQYAEVITTGDPTAQFARLTQQYIEAIHSGDPATQFVTLTQQYVEVIVPFGEPPPGNPHKKPPKEPPGQLKKFLLDQRKWRHRRDRNSGNGRYRDSVTLDQMWVPPGLYQTVRRDKKSVVQLKH